MLDCDVIALIDYKGWGGGQSPYQYRGLGGRAPSLEMITGIIYFTLWTRRG